MAPRTRAAFSKTKILTETDQLRRKLCLEARMAWPGLVVASRRFTAERAYVHARLHAVRLQTPQPAAWWGLCALLSQHQMRCGAIRPMPALWSELLPFLLIEDDRVAERALEEYLAYLVEPRNVDLQWLGLRVNMAMARADEWNDDIAPLLEDPASAFEAGWMALLSYERLLGLRRAVAMYGSDRARTIRRSFWHGMPVFEGALPLATRPRAALPYPLPSVEHVRSRLRLEDGGTLATFRRFRPFIPTALS
jgi:hypothetical protein